MKLSRTLIVAAAAIFTVEMCNNLFAQEAPVVSATPVANEILINGVPYVPKTTRSEPIPPYVISVDGVEYDIHRSQKATETNDTVVLNGVQYVPKTVPKNASAVIYVDGVRFVPENKTAAPAPTPSGTSTGSPGGYRLAGVSTVRDDTSLDTSVPAGTGASAASARGSSSYTAYQPGISNHNAFVGFGAGAYVLKPKYGESTTYGGGALGGGFTVAPSSVGQLSFAFDLGVYGHGESYRTYEHGRRYYETYNDFIIPLLVNISYEFNLGSPQLRARIGPVLGVTTFVSYIDRPYEEGKSAADAVFTYGGNIGFSWTPSHNFYCDFSYRFLGNAEAELDYGRYGTARFKSTAHLFELAVGWRF